MTFGEQIDFINMKIKQIFGEGDISNLKPVLFSETEFTGVTIVEENVDSFPLLPPTAGTIKNYSPQKKDIKNTACVRIIMGYTMVQKMIDDTTIIPFQFSLLINDGLLKMYKELGIDEYTKRKFFINRPGASGCYLRDIDNYAGVELRIYSPKLEEEKNEKPI